jgi:hypothetical protein
MPTRSRKPVTFAGNVSGTGESKKFPMKMKHIPAVGLACCTLVAAGCKLKSTGTPDNSPTGTNERPEIVTSGIGAKFTVPAGQVAIFQVVTRRDHVTMPIPTLAAYVVAPPGGPVAGTFRWFRESEQTGPDVRRHAWRIELVSAAGSGSVGGLALPDALEPAVGRMLLQPALDPDSERIHWQRSDDSQPPADNLIGLRITTEAHDLKTGGTGVAHTDWKNPHAKSKP